MENINALDEISKGSCMGVDAIDFVLEKVEDNELKKTLEIERNKYKDIFKKIEDIYPKYNEGEVHKTGVMTKAMTWYGINMKTLTDHSSSKLAELLLQGTNMGIIEGRRILNNKELDKQVKNIISEYVTMQEDSVEKLKTFL